MHRQTIVYLSGKMRGLPDYGRKTFNFVAKNLETLGYQVINPALLPTGLRNEDYMPICTAMIDACDIVVLIDGWESSQGAKAEAMYADCQGKRIATLSKFVDEIEARY